MDDVQTALALVARRTGGRCHIERIEGDDRVVVASAGGDAGAHRLELPLPGQPGAVLVVQGTDHRPDDVELAAVVARLLGALLTVRAEAAAATMRADKAEAEALFDPLTGVGNRRHWTNLLEAEESRARRHGVACSVIVLDLDGMKELNDHAGHEAGDAVLRRTGAILHDVSRGHDVVARLGGDEFAVLAVGCGHRDAEVLARRIEAALAEHSIAASVGFAGRHPAGGLLHAWRRADAKMYEAKRLRRDREIDLRETPSQRAG
ncbi:MAG: GGDEF domain-containing protein [Actinomycetota bacterium]